MWVTVLHSGAGDAPCFSLQQTAIVRQPSRDLPLRATSELLRATDSGAANQAASSPPLKKSTMVKVAKSRHFLLLFTIKTFDQIAKRNHSEQ